jgi:hypothetical protein
MSLLRALQHRFYGLLWLLPLGAIASQPLYGGPRPVFWLSVLAGLVLLVGLRRGLFDHSARRLTAVWAMLWLPAIASWPASWDPIGTAKVVAVLTLALPAGLFWLRALQSESARRGLEWGIVAVLTLWALDGGWQYVHGADWFGVPVSEDGRVVGPFGGNLRMPFFLALLAPVAVYRIASRSQPLAMLAAILFMGVALLGGTRTQMVMCVLAALACFPAFRWRWRLTLLGSLAILVSALVVVSPLHRAKAEQTIASAATIIPGKPEWFNVWNQRLGTRLTLADAAVNMGLRNPAGVGASAFTEAYPAHTWPGDPQAQYVGKGVEINHAHHVWFQLLGEEGLAGVAGLIAAMALAVIWWRRAGPGGRASAAPYGACLAVYLFPVTSHPPLYQLWLFPVVWVLVCSYLAVLNGGTGQASADSTIPGH